MLVDLLERGQLDSVDVVGISTAVDESRENYPPQEWFEREGLDIPILADDQAGSLGSALGLTSFPTWVLVDADNIVVDRAAGALGADQLVVFANQPG